MQTLNELEIIKDLIAKKLKIKVSDITENQSIIEDLGMDSLDILDLVIQIEEKFSVEIPDTELITIKTVKDIEEKINKYRENL
jgi:acyl carrier protein